MVVYISQIVRMRRILEFRTFQVRETPENPKTQEELLWYYTVEDALSSEAPGKPHSGRQTLAKTPAQHLVNSASNWLF